MNLPLPLERTLQHVGQAGLQQLWQIFRTELALQLWTLPQLREELIQVRLHRRRRLVIIHWHYRERGRKACYHASFFLLNCFLVSFHSVRENA